MRSSDDLKAEYLLLQSQYEGSTSERCRSRAATPLLGAGLAVGIREHQIALILGTVAVAVSLWVLEAI